MIFGRYVKVRESLCTWITRWTTSILYCIDLNDVNKWKCLKILTCITKMWMPHYRYPNDVQKKKDNIVSWVSNCFLSLLKWSFCLARILGGIKNVPMLDCCSLNVCDFALNEKIRNNAQTHYHKNQRHILTNQHNCHTICTLHISPQTKTREPTNYWWPSKPSINKLSPVPLQPFPTMKLTQTGPTYANWLPEITFSY